LAKKQEPKPEPKPPQLPDADKVTAALEQLALEHSANIPERAAAVPVLPGTDAPAPATVTAAGLRVLVEQESGTPLDVAADAGQDGKPFRVLINQVPHDHCSEASDGRWIYRKG
jgi:hypothetical protein